MNSLRFNPPTQWNRMWGNRYFLGMTKLLYSLYNTLQSQSNLKMLEIGSYKGESAFMFASLGIFDEIHCIDPYEGEEEANGIFQETWENVLNEFTINTRHFSNIILHRDYSFNIVDKFPDQYFDFIYIDANHEYEPVKRDIELYLPKTKHLIGGHDYQENWPGVLKAVNEIFGTPHSTFEDGSWAHSLK
jgi:hypothetical protein